MLNKDQILIIAETAFSSHYEAMRRPGSTDAATVVWHDSTMARELWVGIVSNIITAAEALEKAGSVSSLLGLGKAVDGFSLDVVNAEAERRRLAANRLSANRERTQGKTVDIDHAEVARQQVPKRDVFNTLGFTDKDMSDPKTIRVRAVLLANGGIEDEGDALNNIDVTYVSAAAWVRLQYENPGLNFMDQARAAKDKTSAYLEPEPSPYADPEPTDPVERRRWKARNFGLHYGSQSIPKSGPVADTLRKMFNSETEAQMVKAETPPVNPAIAAGMLRAKRCGLDECKDGYCVNWHAPHACCVK